MTAKTCEPSLNTLIRRQHVRSVPMLLLDSYATVTLEVWASTQSALPILFSPVVLFQFGVAALMASNRGRDDESICTTTRA